MPGSGRRPRNSGQGSGRIAPVNSRPPATLKRSLSLPLITLYGVGTTIGAGIFVLVGKVAGTALIYAPVSFLLAAVLAGFSAFAFAELSARSPQSAGEAVYVYEGLGSRRLALAVGLLWCSPALLLAPPSPTVLSAI